MPGSKKHSPMSCLVYLSFYIYFQASDEMPFVHFHYSRMSYNVTVRYQSANPKQLCYSRSVLPIPTLPVQHIAGKSHSPMKRAVVLHVQWCVHQHLQSISRGIYAPATPAELGSECRE